MKTSSQGWYTYEVRENCPIFKTPYPPCPSTSKILPPSWTWTSNFKRLPSRPPASLQMITNQLKENIIQAWLLQVIRSFFQIDFCFQHNSLTLSGFSLTSFYLAEASLPALLCHYTLVCAVVQKYHEIHIFSTPFAISLLQSTNYGTTIAPCLWMNKIKTKTKPCYITFKLTTRSITVRFNPQVMQWY